MPKPKTGEIELLSKSERQKLQKLYHQGEGLYGSLRNLVKASKLPVSNGSQLKHQKLRTQNLIWPHENSREWSHLPDSKTTFGEWADVDKLAKDNNGCKYLLVRQNLFGGTVDEKRTKSEKSKETIRACLTKITQKNWTKKIWVDKGTEFAGELKTITQSWRITNLLYNECNQGCICWTYNRIPEKYTLPLHGRQWIQVHSQIDSIRYSTKFSKNCSIELIPKNVKNSDFLSLLYTKPLREKRKTQVKIGDRVLISKYHLPFRKGNEPQFTREVSQNVANSSRRHTTYTKKDEQVNKTRLFLVIFTERVDQSHLTMELFTIELFITHLHKSFHIIHSAFF